jgi:hypothetical protein
VYQESFLKRLLMIVELFTNIQSSGLDRQESHQSLLTKLASSAYIGTLLNLLVLGSPQVKHIVLKILQQLNRVGQIPAATFD